MTLTIYSRPGCHLCDDMKAVVMQTLRGMPNACAIEEVDISASPELEARYGMEIPVLMVDGKKVAKYRISKGELTRILEARHE